jgi:hypothetical protein
MQTTAVYACVRILVEAIASLPLHVYQYNADGGKIRITDHPFYYLLHDELNPEMTSFIFRKTLRSERVDFLITICIHLQCPPHANTLYDSAAIIWFHLAVLNETATLVKFN